MDLSLAGIACQQIKTKCSEYVETARTKVQTFCRDVEKHQVYQRVMSRVKDLGEGVKDLGEGAKALWVCIFSRKASESEVTNSIRAKYDLAPKDESANKPVFADSVRTQAKQWEDKRNEWFDTHFPVKESASMQEFLAETEGQVEVFKKSPEALQQELLGQYGEAEDDREAVSLVMKKTALLADIAQFKDKRDQHQQMDSVALANDLFECQSVKELKDRLRRPDVPKAVRNELKEKLNKA